MKKRILSVMLVMVLCFLVSCGGEKIPQDDSGWRDYTKWMGKDQDTVLSILKKENITVKQDEADEATLIAQEPEYVLERPFDVEYYIEDGEFTGFRKYFLGTLEEDQEFVVQFFEHMVSLYGEPSKPFARKEYSDFETFFDAEMFGAGGSSDDEIGRYDDLYAVWQEQHLWLTFYRYKNGEIGITFICYPAEYWEIMGFSKISEVD